MIRRAAHIWLGLFFITVIIGACSDKPSAHVSAHRPVLKKDSTVRYARRFAICESDSFKVIYLFASRNPADTTHRIVLYRNRRPDLQNMDAYIGVPCRRMASLSSIYSAMITALHGADHIIAVENIDYYTNEEILKRHKAGFVTELQRGSELNREKAIMLKPDVVFSFGMGNVSKEKEDKLTLSGIPFVICLDHLEETPLARAEWIKFFACFLNKEKEAHEYFSEVESAYTMIAEKAKAAQSKPTVFTELKFGDTWYVPAGKSYMATLLKDAGGIYLWKDDTLTGSLPLSFETVYRKAKEADYWLNVSMCRSLNDMLMQDKRYAEFKAFKMKQVFNNNKRLNANGYTAYWETGIAAPHLILNDLFEMFHGGKQADSLETKLYYYTRLKTL